MSRETILVTGGAGFIGSHLADALLARGHRVRALDCLALQVHGPERQRPSYLDPEVELIAGDVRDPDAVRRALDGVDLVYHLAAAVGVGQSMYEVAAYTTANNVGTAVLMEALAERPVRRIIVASSMSVYGEGLYRRPDGLLVAGARRTRDQLGAHRWELEDADGEPLSPLPTPESKTPDLSSIYALSKFDQERMVLMLGQAYGIEAVALRFFNVFGTRQALSNPYTGVIAIFASRCLNGARPLVFEDGRQQRDFVHVRDVARALVLCAERPDLAGEVLNIGTGRPQAIAGLAERIARSLGREDLRPELTGSYRVGDIRHCFADPARAREVLGFEAEVPFEDGLAELCGWLRAKPRGAVDGVSRAHGELSARGLTI